MNRTLQSWRWRHYVGLKLRYPPTALDSVEIRSQNEHSVTSVMWCPSLVLLEHPEPSNRFSKKVKVSRTRPDVAQRVPGGLGSQISWHSAHEGGEVFSLTYRPHLPPGMFLVLILTRGWVDPRAVVRSEGNMSLKNPVTTPGFRSRDRPTSSAAP